MDDAGCPGEDADEEEGQGDCAEEGGEGEGEEDEEED